MSIRPNEFVKTVRTEAPGDTRIPHAPRVVKLNQPWSHGNVPAGSYMNRDDYVRFEARKNFYQTTIYPAEVTGFEVDTIRCEIKKTSTRVNSVFCECEISEAIPAPVSTRGGANTLQGTRGNVDLMYNWFRYTNLLYQNDSGIRDYPTCHQYNKWCNYSTSGWIQESYLDLEVHPQSRRLIFDQPNSLHVIRLDAYESFLSNLRAAISSYNTNAINIEFHMKPWEQIYYGSDVNGNLDVYDPDSETNEILTMYVPQLVPKMNYFRIRITGREVDDKEAREDQMYLEHGVHVIALEPLQEIVELSNPNSINDFNFTLQGVFGRIIQLIFKIEVEQNFNPEDQVANRVGNHLPGVYSNDPIRIAAGNANFLIGISTAINKIFNRPCPFIYLKTGLTGIRTPPIRRLITLSARYDSDNLRFQFPPNLNISAPIFAQSFSMHPLLSKMGQSHGFLSANGDLRIQFTNIQEIINSVRQIEIGKSFYTDNTKRIRFVIIAEQQKIVKVTRQNLTKQLTNYHTPGQQTH